MGGLMKLSHLQALLENFQTDLKEEFPMRWRFKSDPVFIRAIKNLLANVTTHSDRYLSQKEAVQLAQIYIQGHHDESIGIANGQAIIELKNRLGESFVSLIQYFVNKSWLVEFGEILASRWSSQDLIKQAIDDLKDHHLDTQENLHFCFAHVGNFEKTALAIINLNRFHPSTVTPGNINALLSFIDPENPHRFADASLRFREITSPLTPAQATERFAIFLAEERVAFLRTVHEILHEADPTLPAYRLPSGSPSTFFASHVFAHRIASTSSNPVLSAQVIASLCLLRTLHPEIFQEFSVIAITAIYRLIPDLPVIIKTYPIDRLGDLDDGFLFLRQLFNLNKFRISTDIVLALHATNPELLEGHMERIEKLGISHGQELFSAIMAIINSPIRGRRKFRTDELDFLLSQPKNLIMAAMKLGAVLSREDPIIQSIFKNLRALSSLKATAKSIHPSLGPIASTLGLSGELSLLVTANTFEEQQTRRAFFAAHLDKPVTPAAPVIPATSSIVMGVAGGTSIPRPISATSTQSSHRPTAAVIVRSAAVLATQRPQTEFVPHLFPLLMLDRRTTGHGRAPGFY